MILFQKLNYSTVLYSTSFIWRPSGSAVSGDAEMNPGLLPVATRETREEWPLLTVETEVNGDSKRTMKAALSHDSLGLLCRYKRFLFSLGCCSRPNTKLYFPHRTLFQFLCSHRPASWAGSRAGSPVSLCVSLVATLALAVGHSNHSARSHPQPG